MLPFRDLPVRRKLVLLLWFMSLATLTLTALISLVAQGLLARRQVVQDLEAQAQVVADGVAAALDFADAQAATETVGSLKFNHDLYFACVYDARGVLFAAFQPRRQCPSEDRTSRTAIDRTRVLVGQAVRQGPRPLGHVTLLSSLDSVYRQLGIQLAVLAGLLVAVIPVGLVVSGWLESLVSARILRLTDAAARIGANRAYEVVPVIVPVESRDEIGLLATTFNQMVARLAEQDAALRASNLELEQRVVARTRELADELAERRRAEGLLARRNAELTRANQDLEDFAYITSHDLKEPLRGIQHYVGFLVEDYGRLLDESAHAKLGMLGRLASRMETLIDSLLHYSRVGQLDMSLEPVALDPVVRDVLDSLAVTVEQSGAAVELQALPSVVCDQARVEEVFANLIVNALKYNDKSAKLVEVGSTKTARGTVAFFVRDNGIGIADKHRDAVFRIFKRLHPRDAYGGGVGAGLTIVRKIVERHGGRVWVESEPSVGTTVFFTLAPESPDA